VGGVARSHRLRATLTASRRRATLRLARRGGAALQGGLAGRRRAPRQVCRRLVDRPLRPSLRVLTNALIASLLLPQAPSQGEPGEQLASVDDLKWLFTQAGLDPEQHPPTLLRLIELGAPVRLHVGLPRLRRRQHLLVAFARCRSWCRRIKRRRTSWTAGKGCSRL